MWTRIFGGSYQHGLGLLCQTGSPEHDPRYSISSPAEGDHAASIRDYRGLCIERQWESLPLSAPNYVRTIFGERGGLSFSGERGAMWLQSITITLLGVANICMEWTIMALLRPLQWGIHSNLHPKSSRYGNRLSRSHETCQGVVNLHPAGHLLDIQCIALNSSMV